MSRNAGKRRFAAAGGVLGSGVVITILVLLLSSGGTAATKKSQTQPAGGKKTDFVIFDETNPGPPRDTGGTCQGGSHSQWDFHIAVRAINGDATLRIAFGPLADEWVDYPVPDNTSFSLDESAGSTPGDDTILTVSDPTYSPGGGKLVGWFSAEALNGRVRCDLTQTG